MTIQRAIQLFHNGGFRYIETSPLTCSANQWTSFYMIGTSVTKELNEEDNGIFTLTGQIKGKFLSKNVVNLSKRKLTKAEI